MCIHRGSICKVNCGGYSSGVTPLPIPNRAVKPVCADGSALPGVRVGCCRALRYRMILINIFRYLSFYPRSTSWPTSRAVSKQPSGLLQRAAAGRRYDKALHFRGVQGPYSPDPLRRFAPDFLSGFFIFPNAYHYPGHN